MLMIGSNTNALTLCMSACDSFRVLPRSRGAVAEAAQTLKHSGLRANSLMPRAISEQLNRLGLADATHSQYAFPALCMEEESDHHRRDTCDTFLSVKQIFDF